MDDDSVQGKFLSKEKEIKLRNEERQAEKRAALIGSPYVNLVGFPIGPDALALIREEEARELEALCFFYDGKRIRLAAINPRSERVLAKAHALKEKYFAEVGVYLVSVHSLAYALDLCKGLPKIRKTGGGIEIAEADLEKYSENFSSFKNLQTEVDAMKAGGQTGEIVTVIMAAAVKSGASDVHIEGEENDIKVRFRIDGILQDALVLNKDLWKKIISRMKILAKVKINVSDKPQDGRMSIFLKDGRIDVRMSFLPTNHGESVVMRLLRSSSVGLSFDALGIRDRAFKQLKREVERPNGMIITTGPTGSGKTTTLYAILKKLNDSETKIITVEDPIEYQLQGVNQSQTSEKYTFAHGLRSIVRQDPDVIMVGEIRDLETAEIAIQAALTGHLVLSTIHTNDAAGTVPRFMSMGVKPFLLSPALNAMIGQRLVRRICEQCRQEAELDGETMARAREILEKLPEDEKQSVDFTALKFFKGRGCPHCQGIGYKGRIGIYEIMVMNAELEKLILAGNVSEYDMRENAAKNGMVSMVQDGILKALAGVTSVEEVFAVAE